MKFMENKLKVIYFNEKDKKAAKILEELLQKNYKTYEGVIASISQIRVFLATAYGLDAPQNLWDKLFTEIIAIEMKNYAD